MSETEKTYTEQEYIDIARYCIYEEHDTETACYRYFKAQELNPDNAEAAFFVDYLAYKTLLKDGDTSAAARAFRDMAKSAARSVAAIKEYQGVAYQGVVAGAVAITYTPLTRYVITQLRLMSKDNLEEGVLGLFALGDALKEHFGDSETLRGLAVDAWKEGVALQRQFYAYQYNGVTPESYAAKIQEIEPSYTMPNKSGCISFTK